MNRKKRLAKGIESIHEQIEIHKAKLKEAVEEENEDLIEYYKKDLKRLENEEEKKKEKLKK